MTGTGSTASAGAGEDLLRRHGGETVLITGASSGIGRQLARQFADDGAELVLIARSEDRLRELEMIEVNVAALTRLTALLLPGMLERRRGGILNVASTAAFQPGPNSAVYYATKAYVLSFTEALAEEVRGSGVRVSCLAPGPTDTGFAAQAGAAGSRLFRRGVMDAGRVARAGHDGLRRGKTLVIPGLRNRALAFGVRLSPRILVTKISGYMQA